ncbi:MAG: HTH-type transcriptional regulator CysB [Gammaproteobacteria bacterium]
MKLQQLRYIWEVARNGLNVSATADNLFTSQPGVSKQIRQLEDELGVQVFQRSGKHLVEITPAGEAILEVAGRVLGEIENIRRIAEDFSDAARGSLTIATTHTQARYVLPATIQRFIATYPDVALHMQQGTPMQISELAAKRNVDFAIATEALELFDTLVMLPCYRWNRSIIVPDDHPLTRESALTLEAIAEYPIVTYVFGFTGRSQLDAAFASAGLKARVVLTAVDADVIKTYVRLGLGVGIVATLAFDPQNDVGLTALNADHLFDYSVTKIGFRRGTYLRSYMYDFIQLFAPHLTRELIDEAAAATSRTAFDELFDEALLPQH